MSGFQDRLEDELLRAARRPARLGAARLHLPGPADVVVGAGLTALVVAALAFVLLVGRADRGAGERDASPAAASVTAPAPERLAVQRRPVAARDLLRALRAGEPFRGKLAIDLSGVRLLRRDPGGRTYALLAVAAFPSGAASGAVADLHMTRGGLCLVVRASTAGRKLAARCVGPGGVAGGRAQLTAQGKIMGLVPDGVASVRPLAGGPPVPVENNLYVYDVPVREHPATPQWLDAKGNVIRPTAGIPAAIGPVFLPAPGADLPLRYTSKLPAGISLAQLPSAPAIVTFTADWCALCNADVKQLRRLRLRGITNVFVGYKTDSTGMQRLQRTAGGAGLVLRDPGGKLAAAFGVRALPATYLLDPGRRVVSVRQGPLTKAAADELLSAAGLPER